MEDALRVTWIMSHMTFYMSVLILVLMEDALRALTPGTYTKLVDES